MAGAPGNDAKDPRVPTNYLEDVNGRPLEGGARDLRVPTTYLEDVDDGLPRR
jgi:hypothetical protein